MRRLPNFLFEKKIWQKGYKFIAGIDEVGRGALAGPVVAGCVVFGKAIKEKIKKLRKEEMKNGRSKKLKNNLTIKKFDNLIIDDSKRLTSKQREVANRWIRENALTWGIGEASASEIDRIGIVKATSKAMRKAIGNANQRLHNRIQYLLVDAFYIPYIRGIRMPSKNKRKDKMTEIKKNGSGQQKAIIKGDQKSFSIASASIIAKVYRDNLMIALSKKKQYKKYVWEKNKGYGTSEHRKAIDRYGAAHLHRRSFTTNPD